MTKLILLSSNVSQKKRRLRRTPSFLFSAEEYLLSTTLPNIPLIKMHLVLRSRFRGLLLALKNLHLQPRKISSQYFIYAIHAFFISNAFIQPSLSVPYLLMN